ncbi:MAG: SpoIIE family protein phosphatase [Bacteroidales bacterium]|nr:SpoIIE family protein phosphatase [Bacteroidales bacterium]
MFKKFNIFLFVFFLPVLLWGQKLSFEHYTTADAGLSQSVIICSFQDSYGFLWFGTQNGLNRFDGYNFEVFIFDPADSNSISNNWIFSIVEDDHNNLWIATKDGLNIYNRLTGNFSRVNYKNLQQTKTKDVVYGLFKTNSGNILVNDETALYIYYQNTKTFVKFDKITNDDLSVKDFHIPVFEDSENYIWLGTTQGVYRINPVDNSFTEYSTRSSDNYISNDVIYDINEDDVGNVWVGTALGLYQFSISENKFLKVFVYDSIYGLSNNIVYSIFKDYDGNLWLGTHQGITKLEIYPNNKFVFKHYSVANSNLSHSVVYSIVIDKSLNLWAGTLKELSKADLKPKKYNLIQKNNTYESVELSDNLIASIYKQNDSIIWIGTWGKGLNIYNRYSHEIYYYSSQKSGKNFISNDFIHFIYENNNNDVLVGTRDGIWVYDFTDSSFVRLNVFYDNPNINNLENHRIFKIIQDKLNNYWIATQNGIYKFDDNFIQIEKFSAESDPNNKIIGNLVYDVIEDINGVIWIATSVGLNIYNPTDNSMQKVDTLNDNFIVSLCNDYQGNIWIGTQTGLNYYNQNDKKFTYISQKNGLSDNLIYEILEDKNHDVWFATNNGLSRYNIIDKNFTSYSVFDGLQSLEFNLNAVFQDKNDGEIFFGGMNGVNYFYPDSIFKNNISPNIEISKFEIKNANGTRFIIPQKLDLIELSYLDFEVYIEFSALDFTNPKLNKYSYRMIGISDEWVDIGNRNFVSFSNLPPGDYILEIKGTNNDGVWCNDSKVILIYVKPPFWKTKFAYVAYLFLLIGLIFLIIKIRERRLVYEREILENKVIERTKVIHEQKTKIEKAHTEITSSISYASKIQTALLPKPELLEELFAEHFVLYKPRNVVSGDFYYAKVINNYKVFLVADCTGHGVPGAFLSMLGISLLNDIVPRREVTNSAEILEIMRKQVKFSLNQQDFSADTKDGIEMSLCVFNTQTNVLDFSGANNTLLVSKHKKNVNINDIDKNKIKVLDCEKNDDKILLEYLSAKNPIGVYVKEFSFFSSYINVDKEDVFYLFSDGYKDQFGGIKNHKYTSLRFKKFVFSNSDLKLKEQHQILENEFYNWKGENTQIDDILVIGIKLLK